MDTLVVLGTTTAYIFSAFNTFPTPVWHNIYYDAAAVVVTFILLGKYMELKTKGKTRFNNQEDARASAKDCKN